MGRRTNNKTIFFRQGGVVNYSELMTSEEICENSAKLITFMDLAGHRKYLKTTVTGLTGYLPHYAMIVVSGSAGILGMTQEHLSLALALEVPFFVVVTKIDVTSPDQTLNNLESVLKSTGCNKVIRLMSSTPSNKELNLLSDFLF